MVGKIIWPAHRTKKFSIAYETAAPCQISDGTSGSGVTKTDEPTDLPSSEAVALFSEDAIQIRNAESQALSFGSDFSDLEVMLDRGGQQSERVRYIPESQTSIEALPTTPRVRHEHSLNDSD